METYFKMQFKCKDSRGNIVLEERPYIRCTKQALAEIKRMYMEGKMPASHPDQVEMMERTHGKNRG